MPIASFPIGSFPPGTTPTSVTIDDGSSSISSASIVVGNSLLTVPPGKKCIPIVITQPGFNEEKQEILTALAQLASIVPVPSPSPGNKCIPIVIAQPGFNEEKQEILAALAQLSSIVPLPPPLLGNKCMAASTPPDIAKLQKLKQDILNKLSQLPS